MRQRLLAGPAAALLALVVSIAAARADVIYDFTFTNPTTSQLDGQGTFSTGAASRRDPGYSLITGLTFTALRDNSGTLDTGNLTQTTFSSSAYDPVTEAFISHSSGSTFNDYGGGLASGSTTPNSFGTALIEPMSFSQGMATNTLEVTNLLNYAVYILSEELLTITPAANLSAANVPEPASLALLGGGLFGLGLVRRRRARAA